MTTRRVTRNNLVNWHVIRIYANTCGSGTVLRGLKVGALDSGSVLLQETLVTRKMVQMQLLEVAMVKLRICEMKLPSFVFLSKISNRDSKGLKFSSRSNLVY